MSPGGRTAYSLRRMPELPPSSAAVTTAVIRQSFGRCRRSPLRTTGSPVPPPRATTRESVRSCPVPSVSLGITRSITPRPRARRLLPLRAPLVEAPVVAPPRAVTSTRVCVARVIGRDRGVVAIEHEADDLRRIHETEGLGQLLAWGLVSRNHHEEAVDASGDEAAVRDRDERRRVEHDVVVALARLLQQLLESRQLERLLGRHCAHAPRPTREGERAHT